MKLNKIKFEQGRIHFISEFSVCFDPEILLPWERDVTTSSLYWELSLAVKKPSKASTELEPKRSEVSPHLIPKILH